MKYRLPLTYAIFGLLFDYRWIPAVRSITDDILWANIKWWVVGSVFFIFIPCALGIMAEHIFRCRFTKLSGRVGSRFTTALAFEDNVKFFFAANAIHYMVLFFIFKQPHSAFLSGFQSVFFLMAIANTKLKKMNPRANQ